MQGRQQDRGGNDMALINRITRLFEADFHAVLDHIEEPGQLLRQAIRDMEDELARAEQRIALRAHEQDAVTARRSELESTIADFDAKLDLCFESGKDDLARTVIRKKLGAERNLKHLDSKHAANEQYLEEQRRLLEENTSTLESLRQKAELVSERTPSGGGPGIHDTAWPARDMSVSDDEIEIAFLREKSLRSTS
jgi:phage shock protein A